MVYSDVCDTSNLYVYIHPGDAWMQYKAVNKPASWLQISMMKLFLYPLNTSKHFNIVIYCRLCSEKILQVAFWQYLLRYAF